MTNTQTRTIKTTRVFSLLLLLLLNSSFAQSETKPKPVIKDAPGSNPNEKPAPTPEVQLIPLPPPAWAKDIQHFDLKLEELASKAKVPSVKMLEESDETEAITDGYGGYVDFDARKGTLQYNANGMVKDRFVEWEFELLRDAERSYDDTIAFCPKIDKKFKPKTKEQEGGYLNVIILEDSELEPFKAGDRIRLKASIDDFSRFRKDFGRATGLVAIYHLDGAPHPIFWLKLAKAEIVRLPAKK